MNDDGVGWGPVRPALNQSGIDGFESVRWAWQQLGGRAQYFFQTSEWMEIAAAQAEGDLAWGVLTEAGRPTAASFLQRSLVKRAAIGIRVFSDVRVGDMMYPFSDCVLDAKPDVRSGVALDDLLGVTGAWDVLDLRDRRVGSPWLELAVGRGYVEEEPNGGAGILDTRLVADEWWPTLPVNMRDSIRKARRRIEACGGSEIVVSTAGELPAAYEQFVSLEASGWKGAEATSLSHRPAWCDLFGAFLHTSGTAQVRSLFVGEQLAASQISVTVGGSLVLIKVAYDEELAHLSPGNVLMANLVEDCCEDPAVDRIDCTVWQSWHQRWGMVREPTYRVLAFNHRSVGGALVGAAWHARKLMTRQGGWQLAGTEGNRAAAGPAHSSGS
jgi:hypothetical protein